MPDQPDNDLERYTELREAVGDLGAALALDPDNVEEVLEKIGALVEAWKNRETARFSGDGTLNGEEVVITPSFPPQGSLPPSPTPPTSYPPKPSLPPSVKELFYPSQSSRVFYETPPTPNSQLREEEGDLVLGMEQAPSGEWIPYGTLDLLRESWEEDDYAKHPAVGIYRRLTCCGMNLEQRRLVARYVPVLSDSLRLWEEVVRETMKHGWRKTNIPGQIARFFEKQKMEVPGELKPDLPSADKGKESPNRLIGLAEEQQDYEETLDLIAQAQGGGRGLPF